MAFRPLQPLENLTLVIPSPKLMTHLATPFEKAIRAVEEWLDGEGSAFVDRSRQRNARRKIAGWDLDLEHPSLGKFRVLLSITHDFPATSPQIHFPDSLCLQLPHIEEDGKFCHGVEPSPTDYDDPRGVIVEVLNKLSRYWENVTNPAWVAAEFHRERLAYWSRFCYLSYKKGGTPTPRSTRAVLTRIAEVMEGRVASYHVRNPGRAGSRRDNELRSSKLLAAVGAVDPHVMAVQHGWAAGTLVRGEVLWIPLPREYSWTPQDWPQSLDRLENLVQAITGKEHSVITWLKKKIEEHSTEDAAREYHPKLVILVQDKTCFGYLITPNLVPVLTGPGVIPIEIERVDADWALARDHQLDALVNRRKKRILLLGCGSLGALIADLLARAGVGELHLVDKEHFSAENCARHILGAGHIGLAKATVLADTIRRQVPGAKAKPLRVLAADWVSQACSPGTYDFVIDCTGESSVRTMLSRFRDRAFGDAGVIHVWLEPFGAAAHTVYVNARSPWPHDDPWEKINAAQWPKDVRVQLPACSSGFHPYGAADAWQAAGFATERILACLDGEVIESTIWSWVRSSAYFDKLNAGAIHSSIIPQGRSVFESSHLIRTLESALTNE